MEPQVASPVEEDVSELSVEQLEERVSSAPLNQTMRKDLAYAILYRIFDTDEESSRQDDIRKLREVLSVLPAPAGLLPRAYLSYLDGNHEAAISWLGKHAEFYAEKGMALTCDDFLEDFVYPYSDVDDAFWDQLAQRVSLALPNSAAFYTLKAYASASGSEEMFGYHKQALQADPSFWRAAWDLASLYYLEKNWNAAAKYYKQALQNESAQDFADIYSEYAWVLGKLSNFAEEEQQYRNCIALDPNFSFAKNNLGWSLYRQGKLEEALEMFDDCIRDGDSGKYPLRNRAKTLKKLGRYSEAIEAWKMVSPGGVSKVAEIEISRLQKLTSQDASLNPSDVDVEEADDEAEAEDQDEESSPSPLPGVSKETQSAAANRTVNRSAVTESLLEESLEKLIKQNRPVFERQLRMHDSSHGYGRQFIIPGHGRIDLLCEDIESGDLVVIELKKDESHEVVVGQIAMYMTWVRENIASEGQKVCGIICVYSASSKLQLAARCIPQLEVFEYLLSFIRC
ncbi:MAG: tetratricopeptide repeat protein [Candidatus Obscuribacterales bacterium]|nr:tetratricopeptide repeat protein [Candidatus Obscuribacterales bacterium]